MRYICLATILITLPITADAQDRAVPARSRSVQNAPAAAPEERRAAEPRQGERRNHNQRQVEQRQPEQRQTTGLSTIGLGLSPIGLPPAAATTSQVPWWERQGPPAWEQKRVPSWEQPIDPYKTMNPARVMLDREREARSIAKNRPGQPIYRPGHGLRPPVYVLPPYGYYLPGYTYSTGYDVASQAPPPPPPMPETGFLKLDVEPRQAVQVFVDGLYIGTLADIGDEIELRLGARRIELRAPGYRPLIFDTQIAFDRMVVYRGELERDPAPEAPQAPQAPKAPSPPGSRTMYLIPGCYMGNVQPTAGMLRPGCDIGKLTTISPQ